MKRLELLSLIRLDRAGIILLVAITTAAWFWLDRLGGGVDWLTVQAPRHAVVGESLAMRVHVTGLKESSYLCSDLHWSSKRGVSHGYLASGGAKLVGKEGGSFDFEIRVRPAEGLRFVHGIIFLSPTGDWKDHSFVVTTDLIPVTTVPDRRESKRVRLPVELLEDHARDTIHPTPVPRLLTGFLLLASSVGAWMTCRTIASSAERIMAKQRRWQVLAVALSLACLWELLGLEHWVGTHARALAQAGDIYYSRAVFQKALISVTLAATFGFLWFWWRKRGSYQLFLTFFGLYLTLSTVNLLSFHSIDKYAGLSWSGITLVEALKFSCAVATLRGVCQARRCFGACRRDQPKA